VFKSMIKHITVEYILAYFLAGYMAIIKRTTRWTIEGETHIQPLRDSGDGLVLAVWHGRFFISNSGWHRGDQPASVLVSKSNDGAIITAAAKKLGLGVIRGSGAREGSDKDRGGREALRGMVKHIRNKGCVVITPDGPRALSTRNRKIIKSWDKFMLPFPLGRGAIVWGEPVMVDRKASETDLEATRALLEERMIAVTHRADTITGKEIIRPSDTAKESRQ